jgi:hypothetical protein
MIARAALLLLLVSLALAGCSRRIGGPKAPTTSTSTEAAGETRITDEQSSQFAEALTQAVRGKDSAALATLIDWDSLFDAATAGLNVPEKSRERINSDLRGNAKNPGALSQRMLEPVQRGASYTFLRRHQLEGRDRLLFRLVLPEGEGVNYHDIVLDQRADGRIVGSDIYDFTSGEFLSATARRAYLLALLRIAEAPQARLRGVEREYVQHFVKVTTMNRLVQTGDYKQVLTLYDQLPTGLQQDKNVLLIRLKAAQNVGLKEYSEAIENLRAFHPNDLCADLFSIAYFQQEKQPQKALDIVSRLEKALGGDPYLYVLRSAIYLEANDPLSARKAAEQAIAEEPTLQEAYWARVAVARHEKKFDETLKQLREIDEKFAPTFPDFGSLPEYAEFVKSPQYQEWLKSRQRK